VFKLQQRSFSAALAVSACMLVSALFFMTSAARADMSCTALPGTVDRLACGNVVLTEELAMLGRAFDKVAADLQPRDREILRV
jgi:hypothetical protein